MGLLDPITESVTTITWINLKLTDGSYARVNPEEVLSIVPCGMCPNTVLPKWTIRLAYNEYEIIETEANINLAFGIPVGTIGQ